MSVLMIDSISSLGWDELIFKNSKDFPGIPVVKALSSQSTEHEFQPWLGS